MVLEKWADFEVVPHHLRDDTEAYSLPIVVRVERNVNYDENDAFVAVGKGIVKLFSEDKWHEDIQLWMQGRIRKVVRKARGASWDKLLELDHLYVEYNGVEILIFKPHALNDPLPDVLKKLQVQGIMFDQKVFVQSSGMRLVVSVNPDIDMSSGKKLAQVGHGIQVAILNSGVDKLKQWVDAGSVVSVEPWGSLPEITFEIRDAGFTEIPAGSLTVKSVFLN